MRWLILGIGILLIAVAFAAGTRVADTREGLVAEVVSLLGGLTGISLVLYGLFSRTRHAVTAPAVKVPAVTAATPAATRPRRDLALGGGGLLLAAVLLSGLAISGGWQWAALGCVLLLPMVAGSTYLCARSLRTR